MTGVPPMVSETVAAFLRDQVDADIAVTGFSPVGGGCINHGGRLKTSRGDFFLKWNSTKSFPGMFRAEAHGLSLLAEQQCIDIPRVTGYQELQDYQWILMDFVERTRPSIDYWVHLGRELAQLHTCTRVNFGLDHDNYIGSLPQCNEPSVSWIQFFVTQRLSPQLAMAVNSGKAEAAMIGMFERLYQRLPDLLPNEKPALLHGDLWNGNIMVNEKGNPCLIDPAVFYGNREAEIAFTSLFGGFDEKFYSSYHEAFPMLPGFHQRQNIYNLYPLLVHVNLFGGGYLGQVKTILKNLAV